MALTLTQIQEQRAELTETLNAIDALIDARPDKAATEQELSEMQNITEQFAKLNSQEAFARQLDEVRAAANGGQPRQAIAAPRAKVPAQPKEPDDPKCGFRDIRDQLTTIMNVTRRGQMDNRLSPLMGAAGSDEHGTYSDPFGGFLIAPGFIPELLSLSPEADPTIGMTMDIPMQTKQVSIPARTDKDHSSSVSGGLQVYRRAETQTVASSRMQFEQVKLVSEQLFGVSYFTEEVIQESPMAVVALLQRGMRDEFTSKKFREKIGGTGAGQFEGILNCPAKIAVAKESGQTADTINGTNILKMKARAWRYSQCIWLANHDTQTQLESAHMSGTNGDVFFFAPGQGIPAQGGSPSFNVPDQLLGRPIYFTEYAKTLGDEGDLILWDPSQYLTGTRIGGPMMESSIHVRFLEHEQTFKFWESCDARSWWRVPMTPMNSTQTLSPIVTLAARA